MVFSTCSFSLRARPRRSYLTRTTCTLVHDLPFCTTKRSTVLSNYRVHLASPFSSSRKLKFVSLANLLALPLQYSGDLSPKTWAPQPDVQLIYTNLFALEVCQPNWHNVSISRGFQSKAVGSSDWQLFTKFVYLADFSA